MKKPAIVVFVGASLVGGAWVYTSTQKNEPSTSVKPVQPVASAPAPVPVVSPPNVQREPGCHFQNGDRLAYQIDVTSRLSVALSGMGIGLEHAAPLDMTAKLAGKLDLEVIQSSPSGAIVWSRLSNLSGDARLNTHEMTEPFLLDIGTNCALNRFARSNTSRLRGARAQQSLLWEAMWRDHDGAIEAHNGTGAYEANLVTSTDADGALIERHLGHYAELWNRTDPTFSATATARIRPGAGPWLDSIDAQEQQNGEAQKLNSDFRMHRVASAQGPLAGAVSVSDFTWEDLLPQDFTGREPRAQNRYDHALRAKVAGLSMDQAVATMTDAVKNGTGIERQWPQLAAWLEVHPDQTTAVMNQLRQEQLPPDALNPFFIAVGNAHTREARDALLELKRDLHAPPMIRVRAMFSLIDRDDIDAQFARELAKDAQALGSTSETDQFIATEALLALTTMAGMHTERDVKLIAEQAVVTGLTQMSTSPRAGRVALKGAANLGDANLLTVVTPATQMPDRRTREAAAHVFRRMKPRESEAAAIDWLKRENDVIVRRRLYLTLERQYFDQKVAPSEALARQAIGDLGKETSMISRRSMIRLIARSTIAASPEVRAVLKKQAKVESDLGTNLLNEIAEHLTPDEVREVLK